MIKQFLHKLLRIHFWSDYTWTDYRCCSVCGYRQEYVKVQDSWYWLSQSDSLYSQREVNAEPDFQL